MILEFIFNWLMAVFNYALSLLPTNGHVFDSVQHLDATFFKQISVVNGYLPIKETGIMFAVLIAVQAALFVTHLTMGVFSNIMKAKP